MTNRLLAAFVFFTRLPFWRIREVPAECFKHVVNYWPFAGWLTGGTMAATLWISAQILPLSVAVLLALLARLLLTGCLHEDGLADFFDGFGGGTNRERTLAIMKDSHIGSYGVIGLIVYFSLMWSLLSTLPLTLACTAILAGDAWSKFCAGQQINFLPYARKEEESKAKVVYNRMPPGAFIFAFISGVVPAVVFLPSSMFWLAGLMPLVTTAFLILLMKKRLQGYTGDCCGAVFLLSELTFYFGINIVYQIYIN
ncbi:MAG: cobalamin 5'-phosphate synthase [Bacteroidetes bacterium]|jgi:adenosylcobinamide-GDP ribazoletransferase|nr:cobalamin 5'-phosphate synthase [Bacteroidota bacterium]